MIQHARGSAWFFSFLLLSPAVWASGPPACLDGNSSLPVDNQQVLNWKEKSENQFKDRGHVSGEVTRIYSDQSGHEHFQLRIGLENDDTVEIIYNEKFGTVPEVQKGMKVEACGDYITARKKTNSHPASPDGALIHWVHKNPRDRDKTHEDGFLIVNGKLCGQDI